VAKTLSDFLAHYGVKGMKWGVRRSESQLARSRGSSEDFINSRSIKKNPTRTLSNREIQAVNTRLQLERQYAQLTKEQTVVSRGSRFVKGAIAAVSTAGTIYTLANSPFGKAAIAAGKQAVEAAMKKGG
jgi:hypothetical protein